MRRKTKFDYAVLHITYNVESIYIHTYKITGKIRGDYLKVTEKIISEVIEKVTKIQQLIV